MFVALDPNLTKPAKEPAPPPFSCRDVRTGATTVCNTDTLKYIDRLRSWGRTNAGKLREIEALQPKAPPENQS